MLQLNMKDDLPNKIPGDRIYDFPQPTVNEFDFLSQEELDPPRQIHFSTNILILQGCLKFKIIDYYLENAKSHHTIE